MNLFGKQNLKSVFSLQKIGAVLLYVGALTALNFTLPQREPLSLPLLYAALACGKSPLLCALGNVIATVPLFSAKASLLCVLQTAILTLPYLFYRAYRKKPKYEKLAFPFLAQVPFLFFFPHRGYNLPVPLFWQKVLIALILYALSFVFERGLRALLERASKCRLPIQDLTAISLVWIFVGWGFANGAGQLPFLSFALLALLFASFTAKKGTALLIAVLLSLPLCLVRGSLLPLSEFVVYGCACLIFLSCGRVVTSLVLLLCSVAFAYYYGAFQSGVTQLIFTLLALALPCLLGAVLPNKLFKRAESAFYFYRERTLPRVALNRNRRAVGEQLYEVSALFREMEAAFAYEGESQANAANKLKERVKADLCAGCSKKSACKSAEMDEGLDRLIAVGKAKGRVNLIDLPESVASRCSNCAGLLFAFNRVLGDFRRLTNEMEWAREGRLLLARQARGVSEVLRDVALEQSEEYSFEEREDALAQLLAEAGLFSSEIFVYGEGSNLTVSVTLAESVSGKRLCAICSEGTGIPLTLSEKIPLGGDIACFILRKKPPFDATFGIASTPKKGEQASGDTHSILKIDERRFMVALSDGMGSGEEARKVSDNTLSLLESFYKAKIPSETVLSTVNKLVAFTAEESFSCLDIAAVNLDTGEADVVKIGSPMGFVLSGERLQVLEGESLPMGALEAVHPATMKVVLEENDFLLFMSDGISSAFPSSGDLCAYLSALQPLNPQSLAEEILATALSKYGGTAADDMTVLTVKLTKAA